MRKHNPIATAVTGALIVDAAVTGFALTAAHAATVASPQPTGQAMTVLPPRFITAHCGAGSFLAPENAEAVMKAGVAHPSSDLNPQQLNIRIAACRHRGTLWTLDHEGPRICPGRAASNGHRGPRILRRDHLPGATGI